MHLRVAAFIERDGNDLQVGIDESESDEMHGYIDLDSCFQGTTDNEKVGRKTN